MNEPTQHAPATKDDLLSAINARLLLQNVSGISAVEIMQTIKPLIADAEARAVAEANSNANVDCLAWSEKYDVAVKRADEAEQSKEQLRVVMQQQIDVRGEMRDEAISEMNAALKRAAEAEADVRHWESGLVWEKSNALLKSIKAERDALHGQVAALRAELTECCTWFYAAGVGMETRTLHAMEDSIIKALATTASVPPVPDPSDTLDSRGVAGDERNPVPAAEKDKTP